MDRFKALGVPDDIINLIAKPPLLQSKSKEEYFDLLAALFEDYGATHRVEYLALTQYANHYWRIRSLELARASIIGHWEPKARIALIKDYAPEAYMNFDERLREQYPNGIDSHLLTGRATILANNKNHHITPPESGKNNFDHILLPTPKRTIYVATL